MFQADKKPILFNKELTGNPITFNSRLKNMPLADCKVSIPITQTGSGTPSPDNIRDIVGVQGVNIGQTSGYGEYFRGLLNGTYGFVDLGSLSWALQTSHRFQAYNVIYAKPTGNYDVAANCFCSEYATLTQNQVYAGVTGIAIHALNGRSIYVWDDSFDDAATFKTAMSGVYLIYELAEPSTPVTPEQFATLCQAFGITGNTYQITFGQTVYAGTLDVLTGVLTVTWGIVDLGSMTYYESGSTDTVTQYYTNGLDLLAKSTANTACPIFDRNATKLAWTSFIIPTGSAGRTYLRTPKDYYSDPTAFKTAMNGVQLVYELATPIQIPLGGYLIEAFKGENNLISSLGTITAKIVEVK